MLIKVKVGYYQYTREGKRHTICKVSDNDGTEHWILRREGDFLAQFNRLSDARLFLSGRQPKGSYIGPAA